MIPEFVQAWDANKDKLKAAFVSGEAEFGSYQALVKALLVYVVNPYLKEIGKDTYNTERIHEIDDGEYQGSLLYVIPKNHYQPLFSDYVLTYAEYGSCPLCDLLEGICEMYDKEHPEETADSLMSVCLHLLQRCKIPYAFDEYVSDSDWEVREMTLILSVLRDRAPEEVYKRIVSMLVSDDKVEPHVEKALDALRGVLLSKVG